MLICIFLSVTVVLTTVFFGWTCTYWDRRLIKGPRGFPVVGNMWRYVFGLQHYGDVYEHIYKSYKDLPYVGIYRILNEPAILIRNIDIIKEVMIRNFHHFQNNALWIDPLRDSIVCWNPFIAKSDKWKFTRNEIVPIFTPKKVKLSFPHIQLVCEKLLAYINKNTRMKENCFDAKDLCSKFTLEVVGSAAYGLDAQSFSDENSDFTISVKNLFQPNAFSWFDTTALLFLPKLGQMLSYCYMPPSVQLWLSTIIGKIVDQRIAKESSETESNDFIQWLIDAKWEAGQSIDKTAIIGHCGTFLLEGFETSASLMAFALYEYAMNPNEQKRVAHEINTVIQKYNGKLTYNAIQEMKYLEASLLETLRLHPPMMALFKQCTKSFQMPHQIKDSPEHFLNIDEGMVFIIPVIAIHRDPEIYPNPYKFDPERFTENNQKQHCEFLSFGDGPRMCPGMRFGLTQSKAGLATILSKYIVSLSSKTELPLTISSTTFLTAAKNGIWINLKPI